MNTEFITKMIEAGCCDHGHHEIGSIHTDNLINTDFLFNYNLADKINLGLFQKINDMAIENMVAIDPASTLLSYPISLMCKRKLYSPGNIERFEVNGEVVIIASVLYDIFDVNQMINSKKLDVNAIVCVTNYTGKSTFNGIPIIELVSVNTWAPEDCPYCKDKE